MTSAIQAVIDDLLRARRDPACLRIGVAGGSGSGKSTVCEVMRTRLSCSVDLVTLDRFFKPVHQLPRYYSQYHQAEQPDYNTPDSLVVEDMVAYCRQASGAEVLICDGHFALYYPQMRDLMDIKCFVDCDLPEMLERRTERNLARGYGGDRENISAYNRECVVPRHQQFIQPTSRFADIVIPNSPRDVQGRDALIDTLCQKISQQGSCTASAGGAPSVDP